MNDSCTAIIAAKGSGNAITTSIDSCAQQVGVDLRIVVKANPDDAETLAAIDSRRDIIDTVDLAPDAGIYDAWNQALRHARTTWVTFLGADDAWANKNTVRTLIHRAAAKDLMVFSQGQQVASHSPRIGGPWSPRMESSMAVCHVGALHRRSLFDLMGRFDASFRIAGDYDFLLRCAHNTEDWQHRTNYVDMVSVLLSPGGISDRHRATSLREAARARINNGGTYVQEVPRLWWQLGKHLGGSIWRRRFGK